ncbi:HD family phosphohydrolase [Aquimarina agarivorans]|uniref:HD family phosphohydrolase n=1 Tax=Aquimarina agarivorans TaxID=980584 RepID=UPI000248EC2F|nr:HDIG domain-containing metalloprotein [Aquimarina agarivorans]
MNQVRESFYKNQSAFYKVLIFVITTIAIVYMFPKKGKFKYNFSKGKPWQYENLYAPFNFGVLKSEEDLASEKKQIIDNSIPYFEVDTNVFVEVKKGLKEKYTSVFNDTLAEKKGKKLYNFVLKTINEVYKQGIYDQALLYAPEKIIYLKKGNNVSEYTFESVFSTEQVTKFINKKIESAYPDQIDKLTFLFFEILKPNVSLNNELTERAIAQELSNVLDSRGSVEKDRRIIARGEIIDEDTFQVLKSLQKQYESQIWSENNQNWIVFGYLLLVALALLMLFLFIKKYRYSIYENNTKVTFVIFNMLLMAFITTLVIKYNSKFVYVIPICILPLVIKAFFDARLGFFTHVITVLILGFLVPNNYEYMFLQTIAGIVTILTVSELYKRANLFVSVGQITLVYVVAYIAFHIIQEGSLFSKDAQTFSEKIAELQPILLFVLCGFATLIVHPLIYGFEKIFGLVSDVSLLELSDTNSKLLKELSEVAPGTFHHSLNVANLAEAAANEIGANAMLVRVGALYHDIGKMSAPTYYTENQTAGMNPHDHLSPSESAKIITDHVLKGIEIAKKNNLPDRVVDFIRTHHGTSTVYYFYVMAKEDNPDVDISLFQYPGPIPFSKETAILMMSDSVEAASKSIKNPTSTLIDQFVEKIINKQMDEGQFLNADITFKEIQQIKKVMKRKLNNMYHLRIEYPE